METYEQAMARCEAEQKKINAELEDLISHETHCDEEIGVKRLEKRFFRDFGCINFKSDDDMHELKLARAFHQWHRENWPERHAMCEDEPYRCYHKTVCKCGYSEAYDSSD